MYSRGRSSGSLRQWAAGLLIVIGAVIAFGVYQKMQTGTPVPASPIAATSTHITPRPVNTATPKPVTLRLSASKAHVLTEITEVYLARTDNWDLSLLGDSAGHLQGTPPFGQNGNYVLAGHVELKDGRPGPFAYLNQLAVGDPIAIISDQPGNPVLMQYAVTSVEVRQPEDFDVLRNHGFEELTLITCKDWNEKAKTYLARVVVHARAVTKPVILPPTKKK